jgi:hypothetical protein
MSEERDPREEREHGPGVHHEVMMERVIGFAAGLILLIGASAAVCWLLFGAFKRGLVAEDPPPPPLPEAQAAITPPPPTLQASPIRDMASLREHEDAILQSYGWVDEGAGIAHIPIERAIDLTAERGATPALQGAPDGGADGADGGMQ